MLRYRPLSGRVPSDASTPPLPPNRRAPLMQIHFTIIKQFQATRTQFQYGSVGRGIIKPGNVICSHLMPRRPVLLCSTSRTCLTSEHSADWLIPTDLDRRTDN
ncbi:hypothetical protein CBL_05428 [Carabus blaptoides fortunei]